MMLSEKVFVCAVLLSSLIIVWICRNNFDVYFSPTYGYVDKRSFKAWRDGAVTILQPHIAKNCTKLFGGDAEELKRVNAETAKWKNSLSDQGFFEMTMKCSWVKYYFSNNLYVTEMERSFPIAFSFLVHNSPQQVVRLFKAIYRPHNQYCIIPDLKSIPHFTGTFRNIAACLSNVHFASKLIPVRWGHHSLMDAHMICLKDLLDLRVRQSEQSKWKYVVNLCGKELPLATNHEIVSKLVQLNGSSAIAPRLVNDTESLSRLRGKIPFKLPFYKSSTYMGISYDFANFLFTNSTAIKVREFFKPCIIPEEHFYAVLSTIPGVPGGFNPNVLTVDIIYCIWQFERKKTWRCHGKVVHYLCIPKIDDLRTIMEETRNGDKALFYNKYYMEYDHTLMDCMEEELITRNKREFDEDGNMEQMGAFI